MLFLLPILTVVMAVAGDKAAPRDSGGHGRRHFSVVEHFAHKIYSQERETGP